MLKPTKWLYVNVYGMIQKWLLSEVTNEEIMPYTWKMTNIESNKFSQCRT